MVAAAENILAATALGDGASAMAADVAEGAECALLVADNDNWFADDIDGKEGFGVGDGAFYGVLFVTFPTGSVERADELPGAAEDAGFLSVKDRGIGVELRSERMGRFDSFVNVEMERIWGHG